MVSRTATIKTSLPPFLHRVKLSFFVDSPATFHTYERLPRIRWWDRCIERLKNRAIIEHEVCRGGTDSDFVESFPTIRARQDSPDWNDGIEPGTPRLFLGVMFPIC